jgi:ubiquinone/menaquinone biosynthesis C-methylase UbiE
MDAYKNWDSKAINWSNSLSLGHDLINDLFGMPTFLNQIGALDNLKLLDAGCGEGRSARAFAKHGALVTGVDISQVMIEEAIRKENELPVGNKYFQSSCSNLNTLKDESFDVVTSFMALMDTSNLAEVFKEFYRILKPGQFLAIMVRHPCFFSIGFKIVANNIGERAALQNSNYFLQKPYKELLRFPREKNQEYEIERFPYTLSDYIQTLIETNFKIDAIIEPRPSVDLCQTLPNLNFWREHASLYLYIKATKIGS